MQRGVLLLSYSPSVNRSSCPLLPASLQTCFSCISSTSEDGQLCQGQHYVCGFFPLHQKITGSLTTLESSSRPHSGETWAEETGPFLQPSYRANPARLASNSPAKHQCIFNHGCGLYEASDGAERDASFKKDTGLHVCWRTCQRALAADALAKLLRERAQCWLPVKRSWDKHD